MSLEALWYIPNTVEPGHRGDDTTAGWGSIEYSTRLAQATEEHGWAGALLGTGWGRPDTFTVATALAARTTTFKPLIAVRPGYWQPAQFAAAAATLDQLSRGRVLVNVVSGLDQPGAYGDAVVDSPARYARTLEFMQVVRSLWTSSPVDFEGSYYSVAESSLSPQPFAGPPPLYFGGASPAAERVAALEADVQLFWGEPLAALEERIARLTALSADSGRRHLPLEYGLRITTVVRATRDEAWRAAEEKVAAMAAGAGETWSSAHAGAVGQQRLLDLAARGEVLDTCLYTAPGRFGGAGAGTTWLVGSAADVASALLEYRKLGISRFILSDTPYQSEVARLGSSLLPLLA